MKNGMKMYESLIRSINKAGGTGANFTVGKLDEMTVMELFSQLATNHIRFIFKNPEK